MLTLRTNKPADIAIDLLTHFSHGDCPGLIGHQGCLFRWYGDSRWVPFTSTELNHELWRLLSDAQFSNPVSEYVATRSKIRDITEALESSVQLTLPRIPCWLPFSDSPPPTDPPPDPRFLIAFPDTLVDIAATAATYRVGIDSYNWITYPRTPSFFTPLTLTVPWLPAAEHLTWSRCLIEWGNAEEAWSELRERYYGATLMGYRNWGRFLCEYGEVRAGKGTGTDVLKSLLPSHAFYSIQVSETLEPHVRAMLRNAWSILIPEVGTIARWERGPFSSLLRNLIGRDGVTVNQKYASPVSVVLPGLPIIQSHSLLQLEDAKAGLTSKMLGLHFTNSWLGREDHSLPEKLQAELPGIALSLCKAAVRLVAARTHDPAFCWPVPRLTADLVQRTAHEANPIAAFLDWGFVRTPRSRSDPSVPFLDAEQIRRLRVFFEQETDLKILNVSGTPTSQRVLLDVICERSGWGLTKKRNSANNILGLIGLDLNHASRLKLGLPLPSDDEPEEDTLDTLADLRAAQHPTDPDDPTPEDPPPP